MYFHLSLYILLFLKAVSRINQFLFLYMCLQYDPQQFQYQATWQDAEQRIEMALVSACEQTIDLAGETWTFQTNERLITEHSVKYSPAAAAELAAQSGWRIKRRWHDCDDSFSLHRLEPAD